MSAVLVDEDSVLLLLLLLQTWNETLIHEANPGAQMVVVQVLLQPFPVLPLLTYSMHTTHWHTVCDMQFAT